MVLAFRLYGDFVWPPKPEFDPKSKTRTGTVEIHYAEKVGGKPLHAFLRWIPQGLEAPPPDLPKDNIYRPRRGQMVREQPGQDRLDLDRRSEGAKDGARAAFRGAF